ncbi:peptidase S28 [Fistulina hepatica ATCC 64428]|uniref:Peptidase S28 n=1 Tax=Fistulina hepatica ATCC 64428 TaxID=1128425 RepID=A0A0D7ALC4_9AGAR|nr:peptidase S28 [Fistulina hepatica ATCC 64428]
MIPIPKPPPVSAPEGPVTSSTGETFPDYDTVYWFDQLIDHDNPSLGTFKQRYWYNVEYYEGGGPIVVFTPGESNADGYEGYLTNATVNGLIAQKFGGATVVYEHRYYGESNPYNNLSVASLKYHTIEQAIQDQVYFAQNVNLSLIPGGPDHGPDTMPWILVGGSYSGALVSWTMVNQPDVFFAGYASSAVVEAILDFWRFFQPIEENMPKNCSIDVQRVIAYIDQTFNGTNQTAIDDIKDLFGLSTMTHLDDVAGALRNNMWDWQSLTVYSEGGEFYTFCDALEVAENGTIADENGWGLEHALPAWGNFWTESYYEYICGDGDAEDCLGTYDASQSYWTDTQVDNAYRSWYWIVCNEVGFLQDGPPEWYPAIVTRLVQPVYDLRQCQMMFPGAFPDGYPHVAVNATNKRYKGWDVKENHLFFGNGRNDPWRESTVSASTVNVPSTEEQPIGFGDGFHTNDLMTLAGEIDATIAAVQQLGLDSIQRWLES